MKNILLASAIVLASFQLKAQQTSLSNPVIPERKIHTFYVEAFGQSLYYSFNYDRLLFTKKRFPGTFSVGLSVLPTPDYTQISVPFSFNGLIGKGSHHLELGIGVTPMYFRERMKSNIGNSEAKQMLANDFFFYLTPKIGYRYQNPKGGFFAKATLTPPIGIFSHWGGSFERNTSPTYPGHNSFFRTPVFDSNIIYPWAGISIGWTFKK